MEEKKSTSKQIVRWLRRVGSLVFLILFAVLLARQNWTVVLADIKRLPIWIIPAAFAFYISGQFFNSWRWYVLLHAQNVSLGYWEVVKIVFSGAFASNFLPSTIGGDALRIVSLLRYTDNRVMSIASVVLDRFLNLFSFMTILPLAAWVFLPKAETSALILSGTAGISIPAKVKTWFKQICADFLEAYRLWASHPKALVKAFIVSWMSIFVVFVALWLLAWGLGIPVALYQVMAVTSLTYLLTALPISINGYGVREVAITTLYMRLGATLEQATALAVISRLMMACETLPGAIWMPHVIGSTKRKES
jgi:glycosyltransferase 2 family protein